MSGLDLFAAAIVERLLHYGAELVVNDTGSVTVWFPEPGFGRRPDETDPRQNGGHDGAMRELWTIVQLVPGAREAIRDHVRTYPRLRFSTGCMA